MLSLARRPGQKIRIGDDIVLVVREIRGRQVKIGIEAPPHVRVLRQEIYEELKEANRAAAQSAPNAPNAIPDGTATTKAKSPPEPETPAHEETVETARIVSISSKS